MSVVLKFAASESADSKTLTIKSNTGAYDLNNITGWGAPNILLASALTATLNISKRNSDGTYGDQNIVDVFPTLPSQTFTSADILASATAYGETFADGVYKLIYKVTGTEAAVPFNYETTQYVAFTSGIKCCYQQLAVKKANCSCNCQDIHDKLTAMTLQFNLLCRAEAKGDLDAVQSYIDFIQKMCNNCGCNC